MEGTRAKGKECCEIMVSLFDDVTVDKFSLYRDENWKFLTEFDHKVAVSLLFVIRTCMHVLYVCSLVTKLLLG